MKNRKTILRKLERSTSNSTPRNLVWIDSAPLKKEVRIKCEKLYKNIETTKKTVLLHDSVSIPEYQKWLHSHFGKELTEIRVLSQKVAEKQEIVDTVLSESRITGQAPRKIYERIMSAKTRIDELHRKYGEYQEAKFSREDKVEADRGCNSESDNFEKNIQEELLRAAFEMTYGSKKQWRYENQSYESAFKEFKQSFHNEKHSENSNHQHGNHRHNSKQHRPRDSKPSSDQEKSATTQKSRIKELYRQLSKKLHPDLNPNLDLRMIELWHQVQEAYQSNQIEKLETLSALSDILDQKWNHSESVSTLKNLLGELSRALKQLEKRIREAKKGHAWNFQEKLQNPSQLKEFERSKKEELTLIYEGLLQDEAEIDAQIEEWTTPRRKRRSSRHSVYFDF